jgi:dienelactone hydrolase
MRALLTALMLITAPAWAIDRIPLEDFAQPTEWDQLKLSPDGRHVAGSFHTKDGKRMLAIAELDPVKLVGTAALRNDQQIDELDWVNNERVVFSGADQFGSLAQPLLTGELFAVSVGGKSVASLFGYRADAGQTGSNIKSKSERAFGFLFDTLRADDSEALISVWQFGGSEFAEARRMNVDTGRTRAIVRASVPRARFVADHAGIVRVQSGVLSNLNQRVLHRVDDDAEWTEFNDENKSGEQWSVLGFSRDNQRLIVQVATSGGPDLIRSIDTTTGTATKLYQHAFSDPVRVIKGRTDDVPFGVVVQPDILRVEFFDRSHPDVALYEKLGSAFPGQLATITSGTADGKRALVKVESGSNSGDYFLFDTEKLGASFVVSRSSLMDPELLSAPKPIEVKARDGLKLRGLLTLPRREKSPKALPTIVLVHGGPFGIQDLWSFDTWSQVLADHGYAVLQVNFRGSGGYGTDFVRAGYGEWGGKMQYDVTDATRWAIDQGIADKDRICIAGASYGGYSALMGLAREPTLYRCGLSYVGVSDLELMFTRGDIEDTTYGINYLKEALGTDPEKLQSRSPVHLAAQIQAPVLIVHGEMDQRVPVAHGSKMRDALKRAGKAVEYWSVNNEGHGFYQVKNIDEFHRRQLKFFAEHIGGEAPKD